MGLQYQIDFIFIKQKSQPRNLFFRKNKDVFVE